MAAITMAPEVRMPTFRRHGPVDGAGRPGARGTAIGAGSARVRSTADTTSLRLTRRGRGVVIGLALLAALGISSVAQHASADAPARSVSVETWTVAPGESLWLIAGAVAAPGQDLRVVVAELIELNGLSGAGLQAGQQILVPRG